MMSDGGMFFGGVFMWIFWIIIIIGVVWIVKVMMDGSSGSTNSSTSESPMEILKKRYANGDIDEQEFNRRRDELKK